MSTKSSSHFMLLINILQSDFSYSTTISKIRRIIQRAVKGLLVIREYPIIFPVKCEMAWFFFFGVNRDSIRNCKMRFSKIITGIRDMRKKYSIRREPRFWL